MTSTATSSVSSSKKVDIISSYVLKDIVTRSDRLVHSISHTIPIKILLRYLRQLFLTVMRH